MSGFVMIVSQMYHEHHVFIAPEGEDFLPRARKLAYELIKHKRGGGLILEENFLGDLAERYAYDRDKVLKRRLNINDESGDIYFFRADNVQDFVDEIRVFPQLPERELDVETLRTLRSCHEVDAVADIVAEHFPFPRAGRTSLD